MSEQPTTYWKHKKTGEVCKNTGNGVYRSMETNVCMLWAKEEGEKFTRLPTPQVGEKWAVVNLPDFIVDVITVEDGEVYLGDFLGENVSVPIDDFMLNYRKVEDATEENFQDFDQHQNDLACTRKDVEEMQATVKRLEAKSSASSDCVHDWRFLRYDVAGVFLYHTFYCTKCLKKKALVAPRIEDII